MKIDEFLNKLKSTYSNYTYIVFPISNRKEQEDMIKLLKTHTNYSISRHIESGLQKGLTISTAPGNKQLYTTSSFGNHRGSWDYGHYIMDRPLQHCFVLNKPLYIGA